MQSLGGRSFVSASTVSRGWRSAGGYASLPIGAAASSQSPLDNAQGWPSDECWGPFRLSYQHPSPIQGMPSDELHQIFVPQPAKPFHLFIGHTMVCSDLPHSIPQRFVESAALLQLLLI